MFWSVCFPLKFSGCVGLSVLYSSLRIRVDPLSCVPVLSLGLLFFQGEIALGVVSRDLMLMLSDGLLVCVSGLPIGCNLL